MEKHAKKIWLSPTGLESLSRCPRCFWRKYRQGIAQPEGIVSRLANRFDGVIKRYFDLYRASGELPPMIASQVKGKLQNPFREKYFMDIDATYGFYGKLDELLVAANGKVSPVDHKTSSSDPRRKETLPAYQRQLDAYALLLERNGLRTTGQGYLIYFYPDDSPHLHQGFPMVVHVQALTTKPERVEREIAAAVKVLNGPLPKADPACPFCTWLDQVLAA